MDPSHAGGGRHDRPDREANRRPRRAARCSRPRHSSGGVGDLQPRSGVRRGPAARPIAAPGELKGVEGLSAEAHPTAQVADVGAYEAFVIGSAAYMFHWLKDATKFVKRHHVLLASRPVWLFSSGPLGTDRVDEQGNDVLESTRPKEFNELAGLIHPRGMEVFFGAWDPRSPPIGLVEQVVRRLPAYDATPEGDFRDWAAIDAWSAGIARELRTVEVPPTGGA